MPQKPKNKPIIEKKTNGTIGQKIASLRKANGISQTVLATKLGISRKQITDYETGRIHLNDDMLILFASGLNVTADELLGIKELKGKPQAENLRIMKRLHAIEKLPESRKKIILQVLDDLIKANS